MFVCYAGADRLAGAAAAAANASAQHGLPPGHPLLAAAREQEIMYRELLSRPPYSTDPLLAHQVSSYINITLSSLVISRAYFRTRNFHATFLFCS